MESVVETRTLRDGSKHNVKLMDIGNMKVGDRYVLDGGEVYHIVNIKLTPEIRICVESENSKYGHTFRNASIKRYLIVEEKPEIEEGEGVDKFENELKENIYKFNKKREDLMFNLLELDVCDESRIVVKHDVVLGGLHVRYENDFNGTVENLKLYTIVEFSSAIKAAMMERDKRVVPPEPEVKYVMKKERDLKMGDTFSYPNSENIFVFIPKINGKDALCIKNGSAGKVVGEFYIVTKFSFAENVYIHNSETLEKVVEEE